MSISDRTRKLLWGRSGNRCAICRAELIMCASPPDQESVVGDECHIVSARPCGPRHEPDLSADEADAYPNLLLLCRVHHKLVDDQATAFTKDVLIQIKSKHEEWVASVLASERNPSSVRIRRLKENIPEYLTRITSGKELLQLVQGCCASTTNYDELTDEVEVELIGDFLQTVRDWVDLLVDVEPSQRVRAEFELTKTLADLDTAGFAVFGAREIRVIEGGKGPPSDFPLLHLQVLRKDNESIIKIPSEILRS